MDTFEAKIGAKIKEERQLRGLTQEQLAELSGLSTNHISKLERGVCSARLKSMVQICQVMQISLDEIVYGQATINSPTDTFHSSKQAIVEARLREVLSILGATAETEVTGQ